MDLWQCSGGRGYQRGVVALPPQGMPQGTWAKGYDWIKSEAIGKLRLQKWTNRNSPVEGTGQWCAA